MHRYYLYCFTCTPCHLIYSLLLSFYICCDCLFVYIGLPSAARGSGPCVCHSRGALWGGCGPPAARFGIMSASEAADVSSPGLCPSFAVICSFLERYGPLLDLPEVSFPMLERSLQESSAGEPLLHCCYQAAVDAFTLGFKGNSVVPLRVTVFLLIDVFLVYGFCL